MPNLQVTAQTETLLSSKLSSSFNRVYTSGSKQQHVVRTEVHFAETEATMSFLFLNQITALTGERKHSAIKFLANIFTTFFLHKCWNT